MIPRSKLARSSRSRRRGPGAVLDPRRAQGRVGADEDEPGAKAVAVEAGEGRQHRLQVGAGRARADPADGHRVALAVLAQRLAIRVDAGRHDLDPARVAPRLGGEVGVAGEHQPRPAHALDAALRLALGPAEAPVGGRGRLDEQRVVEVVDAEPARRVVAGERRQQAQPVDQQQVVLGRLGRAASGRRPRRERRRLARRRRRRRRPARTRRRSSPGGSRAPPRARAGTARRRRRGPAGPAPRADRPTARAPAGQAAHFPA